MVVGAFGFKGSGKSVFASYLYNEHGFTRVNFKDSLIAEMRENFVETLEELSILYSMSVDRLFEEKPPIMRRLMQNYGTDVRRKDNDNYWVDKWFAKADAVEGDIVADDVRFENELAAVIGLGGVVVRVNKSDVTSGGTHPSETEQESFEPDFTIDGIAGDHHSIHRQASEILEKIKRYNK